MAKIGGNLKLFLPWVLCWLFVTANPIFASGPVHHQLKIVFEPDSLRIEVQDRISLKTIGSDCEIYSFYLHGGMQVERKEISPVWTLSSQSPVVGKSHLQKIVAEKNKGENCPDELVFSLSYSGFLEGSSQPKENSKKGALYSG